MSFYLDASAIIPLFVAEPTSDIMERWFADAKGVVCVGDLAATEFAAVVSRFVRTKRFDQATAASILTMFDGWHADDVETVENTSTDLRTAAKLVRNPFPKLLAADAIHIATCKRLEMTLITYDVALLTIAAREGVSCERPE